MAGIKLTVQETRIMYLVFKDFSNVKISESMKLPLGTVKKRLKTIFKKFDVDSRLKLTIKVFKDRVEWEEVA